MLKAIVYLGSVGVGVTTPQLFRADNAKVYVVKLQNNRLGPKVLANEALAANLGQQLQLTFPAAGIIEIDPKVLTGSKKLTANKVTTGPHFACEFLSGCEYVGRHNLVKAKNKGEMAGVMLFDHMFHNLDRTWNRKNILLHRDVDGYKLYAIDNTHLFKRGLWTAPSLLAMSSEVKLNYRRTFGLLLKHFLKPADFAPYVERVNRLTDEQIAGAIAAIPTVWLPNSDERAALFEFICRRRAMAGQIATSLCDLIPGEKGHHQSLI